LEDLKDNFREDWKYMIASCYHIGVNDMEANIMQFLKESGFDDLELEIKKILEEYQQKFMDGTITKKELLECKGIINNYFMTRKEIYVGAAALKDLKDEGYDS
jgi:hypothetical protein